MKNLIPSCITSFSCYFGKFFIRFLFLFYWLIKTVNALKSLISTDSMSYSSKYFLVRLSSTFLNESTNSLLIFLNVDKMFQSDNINCFVVLFYLCYYLKSIFVP